MMRNKPASSMQKTYDDCYLICSTAVYFESQKNETEALRSWRDALDQIYYHNAYKVPSGWRPTSQTERALHESLKQMEIQCKDRVDLLEALRESRAEARNASSEDMATQATMPSTNLPLHDRSEAPNPSWLGDGTIPPAEYGSISRPTPPALPTRPAKRPSYVSKKSSSNNVSQYITSPPMPSARSSPNPPQTLAPNTSDSGRSTARTPSPEKRGGMLRTLRAGGKERASSGPMARSLRGKPPAASKAATQAWGTSSQRPSIGSVEHAGTEATTPSAAPASWDPYTRSLVDRPPSRDAPIVPQRPSDPPRMHSMPSDLGLISDTQPFDRQRLTEQPPPYPDDGFRGPPPPAHGLGVVIDRDPTSIYPPGPPPEPTLAEPSGSSRPAARRRQSPPASTRPEVNLPAYRNEYPKPPPSKYRTPPNATPPRNWDHRAASDPADKAKITSPTMTRSARPGPAPAVHRKAVGVLSAMAERQRLDESSRSNGHSEEETASSGQEAAPRKRIARKAKPTASSRDQTLPSPSETDSDPTTDAVPSPSTAWKARVASILSHLPSGVDETAAAQIFNEIVIQGDEVHWDDVAGLDIAKSALKETVVYPFLRPDLFMGLREPARGMLLFGPPGTGKTMLARAVATESRSTFFAISASSLTSKFLGESEKLVRALFALAKVLAPSIIFVDEIDSLLSSRGGGSEHEATRRIKTEFLIQWSDLAKAAAGREAKDGDKERGDATRVLVLAATNLPWAIDEAARRRFVRRQYIPLPEGAVRRKQLVTLLGHQKHTLGEAELDRLVLLTDGFSGSDITALAKDAAMGPLRSLGERLLDMSPEDIRPIEFEDFDVSLINIRPSVGKAGLKEYEDWAKEFGERGG